MNDSYHRTDEESFEEVSSESVIFDVIQTVADEKDVAPLDLPPLAERIDSHALKCLTNPDSDQLPGFEVRFTYACQRVIIRGDDVVVNSAE